jgi:hypothetical protein
MGMSQNGITAVANTINTYGVTISLTLSNFITSEGLALPLDTYPYAMKSPGSIGNCGIII